MEIVQVKAQLLRIPLPLKRKEVVQNLKSSEVSDRPILE